MIRTNEKHLATLRDYVQRSTHWQEGGADRHAALLALKALEKAHDNLWRANQNIGEALGLADAIVARQTADVTYETMQQARFSRPTGWRRKYTLADARREAENIGRRLRVAWEYIDPTTPKEPT